MTLTDQHTDRPTDGQVKRGVEPRSARLKKRGNQQKDSTRTAGTKGVSAKIFGVQLINFILSFHLFLNNIPTRQKADRRQRGKDRERQRQKGKHIK